MLAQEVATTASELRVIAHQVRPSYLEEVPLDIAMAYRCAMLHRRGVPVSVTCSGDFSHLPCIVSDNIYRIFQEALSNASHHAAASHIIVSLARTDTALRLIVSDDGCGFGENAGGEGMGLGIMAERADLINGTLTIKSDATGTTVTLAWEEK